MEESTSCTPRTEADGLLLMESPDVSMLLSVWKDRLKGSLVATTKNGNLYKAKFGKVTSWHNVYSASKEKMGRA